MAEARGTGRRRSRRNSSAGSGAAPARQSRRRTRQVEEPEPSEDEDQEQQTASPRQQLDRLQRPAFAIGSGDSSDEDSWMTTYTDMVTLLLTCLLLLIAVATFSEQNAQKSDEPIAEQLAKKPVTAATIEIENETAETEKPENPLMDDALIMRRVPDSWTTQISRELARFVANENLSTEVEIERGNSTLRVTLKNDLLFPSGTVDLQKAGARIIQKISPILARAPGVVRIEGHTDNVPINNWMFPSNWELSTARASAVVRSLVEAGIPANKLMATGFADTVPVSDNDTESGRHRNRRVVISLSPPDEEDNLVAVPPPAQ